MSGWRRRYFGGSLVWNVLLLIIAGLPPTGSWQDLKDHMREAGDICYADVFHDGTGVVEFVRYEDMKYAVKKLDDTKFKSHEVWITTTAFISVYSLPFYFDFKFSLTYLNFIQFWCS